MNLKEFKMTDIFFLIEAMRYERAANYMLPDMFCEDLYSIRPNEIRRRKENIAKELKKQHNLIRKQYPNKITIEQMRDIARKVYQQTYQSFGLSR